MSQPESSPPAADSDDYAEISLDEPEPVEAVRERRLNHRVTGLLVAAVALAIGLVTALVLYVDKVEEVNDLRERLAAAELAAEKAEQSPTPMEDLTIVPIEELDELTTMGTPDFNCEMLGMYPDEDPDVVLPGDQQLIAGDTTVYCQEEPG